MFLSSKNNAEQHDKFDEHRSACENKVYDIESRLNKIKEHPRKDLKTAKNQLESADVR